MHAEDSTPPAPADNTAANTAAAATKLSDKLETAATLETVANDARVVAATAAAVPEASDPRRKRSQASPIDGVAAAAAPLPSSPAYKKEIAHGHDSDGAALGEASGAGMAG